MLSQIMKKGISKSATSLPLVELKALPYELGALEPVISGQIMDLHFSKHHRGYVNNLN